jgi:hypothetical protein
VPYTSIVTFLACSAQFICLSIVLTVAMPPVFCLPSSDFIYKFSLNYFQTLIGLLECQIRDIGEWPLRGVKAVNHALRWALITKGVGNQ